MYKTCQTIQSSIQILYHSINNSNKQNNGFMTKKNSNIYCIECDII